LFSEKSDRGEIRPERSLDRTCPNCGTQQEPDSKFCVRCGKPLTSGPSKQESHIAGKPAGKRSTRTVGIIMALALLLAVVGAVMVPWFSSLFRGTPTVTVPSVETSTTSAGERLLAQISSPLIFDWKGTKMEITKTTMFRPSGQSLRVLVRVIPTLPERDYSIRLSCRFNIVSDEEVLLARGNIDDLWRFEEGPYVRGLDLELDVKKTVNCYLLFFPDDITFFGLEKAEKVADLQISVLEP